jgi:hypothetical protein
MLWIYSSVKDGFRLGVVDLASVKLKEVGGIGDQSPIIHPLLPITSAISLCTLGINSFH